LPIEDALVLAAAEAALVGVYVGLLCLGRQAGTAVNRVWAKANSFWEGYTRPALERLRDAAAAGQVGRLVQRLCDEVAQLLLVEVLLGSTSGRCRAR